MPTDPVCGMYVPDTADIYAEQDGERLYFCSRSCLVNFTSPEREAYRLRIKLALAWPLALAVLLITYLNTGLPYRDYVLLALSIPVQFYSGLGFYDGAYHAIRQKTGNMDLLISIGTLTAFTFSVFVTIFPSAIPGSEVYFDASTFIITLILTGNYIENITKSRANKAAGKLMAMLPETVHLVGDGSEPVDVPASTLKPGDVILVRPGEILAVDGTIAEGNSEIDQSMLTGESEPVLMGPGSIVSSGTRNLNGAIKVKTERAGKDSTVSQIYQLIQKAASGRAKVQRIADAFSAVFVPIVLVASIVTFIFWYLYLSSTGYGLPLEIAVLAFVSVVVVACPCAIGLAGPITLLISSKVSSEKGIVVKNASSLDRISKLTMAVFDKTGTLTEPEPVVVSVKPEPGHTESEILGLGASVEANSNHPVARSIVSAAARLGIQAVEARSVVERPGVGISGLVSGKSVTVSRAKHAENSSVEISVDQVLWGSITLSYILRPTSAPAIKALRNMGVKTVMITGDSREEASRIASELGIEDFHWEILPGEKSEIIKSYQEKGEYVAFTGDGINDSIALETADVGIAMGSGTDIARESGDLILLSNDLRHVVYSKVIGDKTIRKIRQNIGWAIGYNSVLIPVAAGIPVPFLGLGIYSFLPILSALAMGLSSTSVVLNSMALRRKLLAEFSRLDRAFPGY
ncbi:MAG: cadmium-translocating P-type ATPase [Candidatus Thermoplasmatota archaeon]|jgi:Cu2+-exporting ATPase/Cu+-exporting ATPase|nr:cadmium-translocating P-type ATPase [Candidatus Thermoplasmatota archaeon]MCL5793995.1 cadmium-translocating P-type ATPase [Candidatus Thermoplasmatota archaeon]